MEPDGKRSFPEECEDVKDALEVFRFPEIPKSTNV
jgi:hypothetical protein